MNLFIDTSSSFLILILEEKEQILDSIFIDGKKKHTEQTVEKIDELFQKNKIAWKDVFSIYVTVGPGSYTGVRVALTIAKTIKILNPKILIFGINTLLYYLGKANGASAVIFANNKYYFALFNNWKIQKEIDFVDEKFIIDNNIFTINNTNFDYLGNFLNLKAYFFEIKDVNKIKIHY